jgi:glutathione synthase/RimK-type ligase-like ATP-grasp enzyme
MHFALEGIATPKTLFMNRAHIGKRLDVVKRVCGYPLIIKDSKGSGGRNCEYVLSEEDLLVQLATLPKNKRFIFQQYIKNEYDWGVMVVNGEVVAGEKSYPLVGEFRNNACNGAEEIFVEVDAIPEEVKTMALAASKSLGLSWSRADIIIDVVTKKPYLLEVNRYPGVTLGSDEVQGAYRFLASHIL